MFFENEENSRILADFIRKAEATNLNDESSQSRLELAKEIIEYIYKAPKKWDDKCSFNIKHIGDEFIRSLINFDSSNTEQLDMIYSDSYRFLCEFDFLIGPEKELGRELRRIKNNIQQDTSEIDKDVKSQIIYASYVMPANIAKEFINDANIGAFKDFESQITKANDLKTKWDNEIKIKEETVDTLKDKLEEYKIGFNFVGLYQGFSELASKKKKEAFWLFLSLIGMGLLILIPLIVEIVFSILGLIDFKKLGLDHLMIFLPLISIEIILIYFFRIILFNYKSVKAQIMQIELRQTLCQFIQSYADYSSEIKKQDSSALDKFESLIFSGVISDPEKLPSTYDGIDQIGNFIKSIKNS